MTGEPADSDSVIERLRSDGKAALAAEFTRCRDRLKRMLELRMDRRLQGRVDASDVLQEAYLEASRRVDQYASQPTMPLYLWLRFLTGQKLLEVHRRHLGTQMRDAGREVSLYRGALPQASSLSLAAQLLGRLTTASQAAVRAELQMRLQDTLNTLDPIDREIIALRHYEELTNGEAAALLGLSKSAASNRYIRALKRLKGALEGLL